MSTASKGRRLRDLAALPGNPFRIPSVVLLEGPWLLGFLKGRPDLARAIRHFDREFLRATQAGKLQVFVRNDSFPIAEFGGALVNYLVDNPARVEGLGLSPNQTYAVRSSLPELEDLGALPNAGAFESVLSVSLARIGDAIAKVVTSYLDVRSYRQLAQTLELTPTMRQDLLRRGRLLPYDGHVPRLEVLVQRMVDTTPSANHLPNGDSPILSLSTMVELRALMQALVRHEGPGLDTEWVAQSDHGPLSLVVFDREPTTDRPWLTCQVAGGMGTAIDSREGDIATHWLPVHGDVMAHLSTRLATRVEVEPRTLCLVQVRPAPVATGRSRRLVDGFASRLGDQTRVWSSLHTLVPGPARRGRLVVAPTLAQALSSLYDAALLRGESIAGVVVLQGSSLEHAAIVLRQLDLCAVQAPKPTFASIVGHVRSHGTAALLSPDDGILIVGRGHLPCDEELLETRLGATRVLLGASFVGSWSLPPAPSPEPFALPALRAEARELRASLEHLAERTAEVHDNRTLIIRALTELASTRWTGTLGRHLRSRLARHPPSTLGKDGVLEAVLEELLEACRVPLANQAPDEADAALPLFMALAGAPAQLASLPNGDLLMKIDHLDVIGSLCPVPGRTIADVWWGLVVERGLLDSIPLERLSALGIDPAFPSAARASTTAGLPSPEATALLRRWGAAEWRAWSTHDLGFLLESLETLQHGMVLITRVHGDPSCAHLISAVVDGLRPPHGSELPLARRIGIVATLHTYCGALGLETLASSSDWDHLALEVPAWLAPLPHCVQAAFDELDAEATEMPHVDDALHTLERVLVESPAVVERPNVLANLLDDIIDLFDRLAKHYALRLAQRRVKAFSDYHALLARWRILFLARFGGSLTLRDHLNLDYVGRQLDRLSGAHTADLMLGYGKTWLSRLRTPDEPANLHQLHNNLHQGSLVIKNRLAPLEATGWLGDIHALANRFRVRDNPLLKLQPGYVEMDLGLTVHKTSIVLRPREWRLRYVEPPSSHHTYQGRLARPVALSILVDYLDTRYETLELTSQIDFFLGDAAIEILVHAKQPLVGTRAIDLFLQLLTFFESTYQFSGEPVEHTSHLRDALRQPSFYRRVVEALPRYRAEMDASGYNPHPQANRFSVCITHMCLHRDLFEALDGAHPQTLEEYLATAGSIVETRGLSARSNEHMTLCFLAAALFPSALYEWLFEVERRTPLSRAGLERHLLARTPWAQRLRDAPSRRVRDWRALWRYNPWLMTSQCIDDAFVLEPPVPIIGETTYPLRLV